jgi:hypothetical protein
MLFAMVVPVESFAQAEEILDFNQKDSARDTTTANTQRTAVIAQPAKQHVSEKGPSIGLSIEPQIQFYRQGSSGNGSPALWDHWWNSFSFCVGIRPAYSFTDHFNIGISFDNLFQRPYSVLMMQTYLGLGPTFTLSRRFPVCFGGDFGYCFWYYPGNGNMNALYGSNGFGYSFSAGFAITRHLTIAAHFCGLFPEKNFPNYYDPGLDLHLGQVTALIQSNTLGIRLIYKIRKFSD